MTLKLIYRRDDAAVFAQIDDPISVEITNADRADAALIAQTLHRSPRAVNIAIWLMNEIKVEVVKP